MTEDEVIAEFDRLDADENKDYNKHNQFKAIECMHSLLNKYNKDNDFLHAERGVLLIGESIDSFNITKSDIKIAYEYGVYIDIEYDPSFAIYASL